jgi:hypothetical protein
VFDNGVRVVDGRLFKASPPPCWALSRSRRQAEGADTIVGRLVAVDYDYPDLVTKLGDSTFMSKMDDACMPFALVGDDDKSAFSHGVVGAERAFPVVDRLEVHAISGDFDALLDPHRLRLLRDHVVSALDEVAWSKVPLGLRGPLAVLQETLEAGCFGDGPTTHRLGQVRRLLERIAPRVVLLDGVVGSLYVEVFKMTAEAVPLTLAGEDPLPDEDFSEFAP